MVQNLNSAYWYHLLSMITLTPKETTAIFLFNQFLAPLLSFFSLSFSFPPSLSLLPLSLLLLSLSNSSSCFSSLFHNISMTRQVDEHMIIFSKKNILNHTHKYSYIMNLLFEMHVHLYIYWYSKWIYPCICLFISVNYVGTCTTK